MVLCVAVGRMQVFVSRRGRDKSGNGLWSSVVCYSDLQVAGDLEEGVGRGVERRSKGYGG